MPSAWGVITDIGLRCSTLVRCLAGTVGLIVPTTLPPYIFTVPVYPLVKLVYPNNCYQGPPLPRQDFCIRAGPDDQVSIGGLGGAHQHAR